MRVKSFLKSLSRGSSAVSLPAEDYHTITISEATPRASLSQDSIEIKIQVDTILPRGPCRLHDPFSREDHEECDWYLGCCLRASHYDEDRADKIFPTVKGYGGKLMSRLNWPQPGPFEHPNIRIDILQGAHRTNNSSIYHIHWEHLERVQRRYWPGLPRSNDPVQVSVRRVLDPPPVKKPRNTRQDKQINVLLVIARRLKRGTSGLEDLSPAMVYRSIMKVKKLLLKERSHYAVHLEVVRPGSFQALEDHLARKKVEHGQGFFHLIHFDLHGEVSDEGEQQQQHNAYLSFANANGKLRKVPAANIAKLLHEHEISSVVLTACESGKSSKGDDADLCRIFAERGVSHILAMSFGIHGQAVEILCDSFYRNLLVHGETFSESARKARIDLFDKPERKGRTGHTRELEDWFIPVAYVPKEERPFVQKRSERPSFSSTSHLDVYGHPFTYTPSHESARSNMSYNDYDVEMDVDILRIEEILMRIGNVLLRGPIVEQNAELVDRLLSSWVSTGLLGDFDRVDAGIFFSAREDHDAKAKEVLAHVHRISKKTISKKLRENYIEPQKAFEQKALRKAAVKLTGIDKLFPKEKPTPEAASELKAAVERFERFLNILILGPKGNVQDDFKVDDYKVPFLIIIGEDSDDILTGKFVNRYPDLGLEAVFRDRPFDLFAF
ncbi:uncharacterized protein LY89DRAFT_726639 [Mollisia scopiformis]|uniref:CHAT domain-containing protein n=1 Tax=Mollisia scopiformis TaxID=149040 RepID=A0A132B343_MOLSC|nr:uncharacterized protein LY89DRAFT_726639 [Mollisia scopiformis]KUJ06334.1 hypothetical protein LY89DRAFT_726639 [Mollisia scopiformis]